MRIRLPVAIVFVIALFVSGTLPALGQADSDRRKVERARMERQIRKEILSLPYYGVFDAIGYEIVGNVVKLNGYVVRPYTHKEAGEAVADIEGV